MKNKPSLVFFILCWTILSFQIIAFLVIGKINYWGLHTNIALGAADALIILSPFFLLNPRWRWTIVFPMTLFPIYLYVNLLYLRNFGDMMGFTTMFGFSNATGVVAESSLKSMRWNDLYIIIPFLAFFVLYFTSLAKIRKDTFTLKFKIISVSCCVIVFLCGQLLFIYHFNIAYNLSNTSSSNPLMSEKFYYNKFKEMERRYNLQYYGFIPYLCIETYNYVKPKYFSLSNQDKNDINDYFTEIATRDLLIDSIPNNRNKNLILIVVESLNSDALYIKSQNKATMPFLSSILTENGIIVLDKVMSQVGVGRSSDGRFIYQTGLLPLPSDPIAMSYLDFEYPSLSRSLKRDGIEFDCGNPIQWNKTDLSRCYGFKKIYTGDTMLKNMKKLGGKDIALFTNSLKFIKELHQPFYVALNTMDMHDPYDKYGWKKSEVWKDSSFSLNEKVYIEKCRQFDAGLSQFIATLKKENLYNNTVIVIAGDHNARESALIGNKFLNKEIPIIILNSGIDLKYNERIGQIDLYPTILDIMGCNEPNWKGLGTSIFRNPAIFGSNSESTDTLSPLSYPSPKAWEISDKLIRSGYFKNYK